MIHCCTRDAVLDLERNGMLVRISDVCDPYLEMASIQRRLYAAGGPSVLFERVKGSPYPAVSNLFASNDQGRFLFRHTLRAVETVMKAKADPASLLKRPGDLCRMPLLGLHALPRRSWSAPVMATEIPLHSIPQIVSWPEDGGPFVTLPQVCTLEPGRPSILRSNLGMYRIQLAGNEYTPDQEAGMHYQIHRGIGIHHHKALQLGQSLKVTVFVGGPPAHAFSAVMPLPEGVPEVSFAGVLAGRSFRYTMYQGWIVSSEADFCILGEIAPDLKPEGPFGDHLGYYSAKHAFPYLKVHKVFARKDAIWPFTVVGRPPQEDTTFGDLIHEMTGPMVPASVPGLRELHAVDAAGVHPLLLAIGSERYAPYENREPMEVLTIANALLGFNQVSLSKVLVIAAGEDNPKLHAHDIEAFWSHVLCRLRLDRDLHFHTSTTIDTLDYTGTALNHGSKLVMAVAGSPCRELGCAAEHGLPSLPTLPHGFGDVRIVMPGVLAMRGPTWTSQQQADESITALCAHLQAWESRDKWPIITLVDDSEFVARNLDNWLWTTFTRINPSHDISGVAATQKHKHWACSAPLVFDARAKNHHARPLVEDTEVERRVDRFFSSQGPLARWG